MRRGEERRVGSVIVSIVVCTVERVPREELEGFPLLIDRKSERRMEWNEMEWDEERRRRRAMYCNTVQYSITK